MLKTIYETEHNGEHRRNEVSFKQGKEKHPTNEEELVEETKLLRSCCLEMYVFSMLSLRSKRGGYALPTVKAGANLMKPFLTCFLSKPKSYYPLVSICYKGLISCVA